MDTLTFHSRFALVWALSVVAACGSDPATAPNHNSANGSDEGDDGAKDDDTASDDTSSDSTSLKDAGKAPSKDAGAASKMDASTPAAKDAGKSVSDAGGGTKADAGAGSEGMDAGSSSSDAGTSTDAGSPKDAGNPKDAGSTATDAGKGTSDSGTTTGAGSCSGATPHGCYVPESDNPMGCPPQIHEQSAFYPPMDEWVACSSPYYTACNYTKPTGGAPAHCDCDLGLHWLCTY